MNKIVLSGITCVLFVLFSLASVEAIQSPPNCNADNSVVNIARSTISAQPGETITFTVSAGNPSSPDGCDITNRTMRLTLPNGTYQDFGPNNYPNPTAVTFVGSLDYIGDTTDLVGGSWTAMVEWTGTLSDGFDNPSNGDKAISVNLVPVYLEVTKNATTAIEQTYTWTIEKSVTPAEWELFDGETGTSEYNVSVVKTLSGIVYSVSGTIIITNPSVYVSANITGVTDVISPAIGTTVYCPVSFPYELGPGMQLLCTYEATLPDSTTRVNNATVTTTGDIGGGSGTADVNFTGVNPTVVNGSIYVDDTNGGSWFFSDSGSVNYLKTFNCSGLTYTGGYANYSHPNTATIRGTSLHDDANVDVDCYKLSTSKTAETTFDRQYIWDIEKEGSTSSIVLNPGETGNIDYYITVFLDGTPIDYNFDVIGTITVHNPAPIPAILNGVSDDISGLGAATVDCPVLFPYVLAAGGDLVCTYNSTLPDGTERTNNGTATQQLYDYDKYKVATADGTKDYSGTAPVVFGNDPDNSIDDCVNVSDTFGGFLGTACFGEAPKTFGYTRTVGPYPRSECGVPKFIDNTASFVTDDTQATGNDSWRVIVNVECPPSRDDLQLYFLKKSFDFCDDGIHPNDGDEDIPGGAVPDGFDVQSSGCVDRWRNDEQFREDNYAFTGEQIAELVVARDLDGAIAISHAILLVDGDEVAYCNEVDPNDICSYDAATDTWYDCSWKGHSGPTFDALMNEYPPQKSEATSAGFDPLYDKLFECFLTVTDDMDGESVITVEAYDVVNDLVAWTDDQMWFFNPEVSLDIWLSEGSSVEFEYGYAGDLVYSTNRLMLENAAEGGVDIAVWLGGTDLTSHDMAAKCPWSNILDVEGVIGPGEVAYSGMEFRCNLDNGLFIEQCWQQIKNKNIKLDCNDVWEGGETCDFNHDALCLGVNPLFHTIPNILKNGHEADCSFKLQYPVPCIGEFTDGNLIILMRAI